MNTFQESKVTFQEAISANRVNDIFLSKTTKISFVNTDESLQRQKTTQIFFVNTDDSLKRQKTLLAFAFEYVEHRWGDYVETASHYLDKKPFATAEIKNNGKEKFTFAESDLVGMIFETPEK